MTNDPTPPLGLLIAANHAHVSSEIGRWLVHDIRGPLQGVTLTLALLAEPDAPPFDDTLREALATASADFGGIIELADRLLRLPELDDRPAPIPLGGVLLDAQRFFARRRTRTETAWPSPDTIAGLPPVSGVAEHLLHVVLSLLLRGTHLAGPHGRLVIGVDVTDENIELTLLAMPHPPVTDPAAAVPGDGADLKVEASRALLELAGGELAVSASADGTTFTARLPTWNPGRTGE